MKKREKEKGSADAPGRSYPDPEQAMPGHTLPRLSPATPVFTLQFFPPRAISLFRSIITMKTTDPENGEKAWERLQPCGISVSIRIADEVETLFFGAARDPP